MAVPKTAVHQDNFPVLRQDYIWLSGQVISVQAKPIAHPMECGADREFWARVFASYAAHER